MVRISNRESKTPNLQQLPQAMRRLNQLLDEHLTNLRRIAALGATDRALKDHLETLLRLGAEDLESRTDLLKRATLLLAGLGSNGQNLRVGRVRPGRRS